MRKATTTTAAERGFLARGLLAALGFALLGAMSPAEAEPPDRGSRRFERPPAERQESRRDEDRRDRDERRRADDGGRGAGQLSPEERRRLREDVEAARDMYRRRR